MKKIHLAYYLAIIGCIIAINSGLAELLLDLIMGAAWSSQLIHFLKESTQHLIVILLLAIYLDFIRPVPEIFEKTASDITMLKAEVSNIQELVGRSSESNPSVLMERALHSRYGEATNIDTLLSAVLPHKPSYENYRATYVLEDMPSGCEYYQLTWEQSFSTLVTEYVVALVNSAALQDVISAAAPAVNDVFVFSDATTNPINEAPFNTGKINIKYMGPVTKGLTDCSLLPFSLVERNSYPFYLGAVRSSEYEHIKLWVCSMPPIRYGARCSITYSFQMRKDDHYTYWVADRPIFVESIIIDASRFGVGTDVRFICQPFIASHSSRNMLAERNRVYSIDIHNWVLQGQGVIFSWR